jgi:transposase
MRGADERQAVLFSMRSIEDRIPQDHPLRAMRRLVDPILVALSPRFQKLYFPIGRPSIPPEQLLRALLLQVLYTVRSERQLMEQLDYNLLYRWFVGLTPDDAVWVATVFTKNRDRLLEGNVAQAFFQQVRDLADAHALLSHEHFTVDGTLLEAAASHKSFQPIDGPPPPSDGDPSNPSVDFHGQKRSNKTHRSVTDPDARLARKSNHTASILAYQASVLTENRHGLIVETDVRAPGYTAECDAGLTMLDLLPRLRRRRTIGADKGYDTPDFVAGVRQRRFTPHISPNPKRYKAGKTPIDKRTTAQPGFAVSQLKRKLVEQNFGWQKVVALVRKLRHRGTAKVDWIFTFTSAAFNLVRMRTLLRPQLV